jgi:hypothetical protein
MHCNIFVPSAMPLDQVEVNQQLPLPFCFRFHRYGHTTWRVTLSIIWGLWISISWLCNGILHEDCFQSQYLSHITIILKISLVAYSGVDWQVLQWHSCLEECFDTFKSILPRRRTWLLSNVTVSVLSILQSKILMLVGFCFWSFVVCVVRRYMEQIMIHVR